MRSSLVSLTVSLVTLCVLGKCFVVRICLVSQSSYAWCVMRSSLRGCVGVWRCIIRGLVFVWLVLFLVCRFLVLVGGFGVLGVLLVFGVFRFL